MKLSKKQKIILIISLVILFIVLGFVTFTALTSSKPKTSNNKDGIDPISGEGYIDVKTGGTLESNDNSLTRLGFTELKTRGLPYSKQQAFEDKFSQFAQDNYPEKSKIIRIEKNSIRHTKDEQDTAWFVFNTYLSDETYFQIEIENEFLTPGKSTMIFRDSSSQIVKEFKI